MTDTKGGLTYTFRVGTGLMTRGLRLYDVPVVIEEVEPETPEAAEGLQICDGCGGTVGPDEYFWLCSDDKARCHVCFRRAKATAKQVDGLFEDDDNDHAANIEEVERAGE